MKNTVSSSLTLPVEVVYEILPAEFGLPEQVDIVAVNITVRAPLGAKERSTF
jgi:hypothetical protein